MVRAEAVRQEEGLPGAIQRAGDAMILVITRAMWETLLLQGRAENLSPGQILDKALKGYLEKHGCEEAASYICAVAEGRQK